MENKGIVWGPVLLALVIGAGLGALGMSLREEASETIGAESREGRLDDGVADSRGARRSAALPSAKKGTTATEEARPGSDGLPVDEALISAALMGYARDEITAGWAELRQDEIPEATLDRGQGQFEEQTRALPRALGRELAGQATKDESWDRAVQAGDGITLIEVAAERNERPPVELIADDEIWRGFFEPRTPEKLVTRGPATLKSGSTIELGAGVFDLSRVLGSWGYKESLSDIRIRGAGRDATLIVLSSDLSPNNDVDRMSITDCTVHCNNNYFFDHRRGGTVLSVERVRIVGFDMGAGGSCMMGCRRLMMSFRDCEILGGYSRAQVGYGDLFDVRSTGHVARFDNCLVRHVELGSHNRGTLLFRNCRLEEILDDKRRLSTQKGKHFVDCEITHFESFDPQTRKSKALKHDLNDLFPDWKARLVKF